jgi:hypothetical protein
VPSLAEPLDVIAEILVDNPRGQQPAPFLEHGSGRQEHSSQLCKSILLS